MQLCLAQQLFVVHMSIRLSQPEIVDGEVGVVPRAVPHVLTPCVMQEKHRRCKARECCLLTIGIGGSRNIERTSLSTEHHVTAANFGANKNGIISDAENYLHQRLHTASVD